MRRLAVLGSLLGTAIALFGPAGTALAGGGCHGGVTQQDARDQDEARVRMIGACFEATITTVDPGTPVTFVNDDLGITHNLGGNGWGHFQDMVEGDTFTAAFDEPGVYPFACNYHPGMTGAIVVGDGLVAGSGEDVTVLPIERVGDTAPASGTGPTASTGRGSGFGSVGIGVLGLALGAAGSVAVFRLRRTRPAA